MSVKSVLVLLALTLAVAAMSAKSASATEARLLTGTLCFNPVEPVNDSVLDVGVASADLPIDFIQAGFTCTFSNVYQVPVCCCVPALV